MKNLIEKMGTVSYLNPVAQLTLTFLKNTYALFYDKLIESRKNELAEQSKLDACPKTGNNILELLVAGGLSNEEIYSEIFTVAAAVNTKTKLLFN